MPRPRAAAPAAAVRLAVSGRRVCAFGRHRDLRGARRRRASRLRARSRCAANRHCGLARSQQTWRGRVLAWTAGRRRSTGPDCETRWPRWSDALKVVPVRRDTSIGLGRRTLDLLRRLYPERAASTSHRHITPWSSARPGGVLASRARPAPGLRAEPRDRARWRPRSAACRSAPRRRRSSWSIHTALAAGRRPRDGGIRRLALHLHAGTRYPLPPAGGSPDCSSRDRHHSRLRRLRMKIDGRSNDDWTVAMRECQSSDLSVQSSMTRVTIGVGGPSDRQDRAARQPLQAAARSLQPRRRHQRHLHLRGRRIPDAIGRAAARTHPRRADRRMPAHRHPRRHLHQSRSARRDAREVPRRRDLFLESGGDNLAASFSPELVDVSIYVIDVAGGDKVPPQGWARRHSQRSARRQQD